MRAILVKAASILLPGAGVLVAAAVAIAAHPVKGATYRGNAIATRKFHGLTFGGPVSFKVLANGSVGDLKVPIPAYCQYGGIYPPKSATAQVTRQGTFNKTLKVYTHNGQYEGKVTVTGTFYANGKESGKLHSYLVVAFANCDTTWTYSTTAR